MKENESITFGHCELLHYSFGQLSQFGRETFREVTIELQGPYAQYDRHIVISALRPRKRKADYYHLYPDGLQRYVVAIANRVVFNSGEIFPTFVSLEAARFHKDKIHELRLKRIGQEI